MSDEPTECIHEKRLRELQRKYIDLTMNSKVLDQDVKHWRSQAKALELERIALKHKLELSEKENEELQNQVEHAAQEQVRLKIKLKARRRENRGLKKKVGGGRASELEEVTAGLAEVSVFDEPKEEWEIQAEEVVEHQPEWENWNL